jgi:hypothetical protein
MPLELEVGNWEDGVSVVVRNSGGLVSGLAKLRCKRGGRTWQNSRASETYRDSIKI